MRRDPDGRRGCGQKPACTFTAVPEGSSVPLGQLLDFDPARYMASFRQHVNRVIAIMANKPDGILFACLQGAYDPATETYPIHLHGSATGGMIQAVDGLRQLKKYAPAEPWDGRDAANTPIVMSRGPLTNMPAPLTYILKRYWPKRETYMGSDGRWKAYSHPVQRIPEPAHSEYLMFLDSHRLEELTLLMGMHTTNTAW